MADDRERVIVGVTGASGAAIAVRVLDALKSASVPVTVVVSDGGAAVLSEECGLSVRELGQRVDRMYGERDLSAPIASGSRGSRGMVIVPCSSNTVAKVALGLADTLITRAAHVHIKERRPMIIVPRETPLSAIHLRHLASLAELGVVVLDAAPPYYTHPKSVDDQVAFLAGKVLDHLGVSHQLYRGWREGEA